MIHLNSQLFFLCTSV